MIAIPKSETPHFNYDFIRKIKEFELQVRQNRHFFRISGSFIIDLRKAFDIALFAEKRNAIHPSTKKSYEYKTGLYIADYKFDLFCLLDLGNFNKNPQVIGLYGYFKQYIKNRNL